MSKIKTIALINHGCAKNLVDSELILGLLAKQGYSITLDEDAADIVVINTCSFIHDAEKESVQSILQVASENKKIIVTGCLAQKHKKELKEAIPEISALVGTTDYEKITAVIEAIEESDEKDVFIYEVSENPCYKYVEEVERQQITVGSSSYLKIADGCNFECGYCIIPKLRGKYASRPIENIVKEAESLVSKGVNEIVLIAQDTTSYGIDLYKKPSLARLLRELNKIDGLSWLRIMYTYPSLIDDELIETIKSCDKVVKYLDIPLQHSSAGVLKSMKRPVVDYEKLINKLRKQLPTLALRTTFIVGYPGETQEDFEHLYNFIKKMRFDKLGVFEYSKEKNTYSYNLKNQVPAKIKRQRKNAIMKLQKEISKEINLSFIGKTLPCIIEAQMDDGLVVARSYRDAPEVDGLVYIKTDEILTPSDIEEVTITKANDYDLYGKL